ncbi:S8 family serine peptidase [Glaesserella sp.]|uniref:S8 family peptidase n=1 Tax=Glaesserella sp. TaxID=2094731 RepID=UPI0035A07650
MEKYPFHKTLIVIALGSLTFSLSAQEQEAETASTINPHETIGLTEALSQKYSGKNVRIGIVDSGYLVEHPLVNRSKLNLIKFTLDNLQGKTETFDPAHYEIEVEQTENGKKEVYNQHGGQVAGTIGAVADSNSAYRGGIAPQADLYIATTEAKNEPEISPSEPDSPESEEKKITSLLLDNDEDNRQLRRVLSTALSKVAENKPFAINNSWNEDPQDDTVQEVDQRYKAGIMQAKENVLLNTIKSIAQKQTLLVFAAGNEKKRQPGIIAALPRYLPELEPYYLSVVAVDTDKNLETYSNHCGVSKQWCIAAPGTFTLINTEGADTRKKIDGLATESGTSYAAPVVTGSLALLKERFAYFTPTQIRDTLLTTAEDLGEKGVDDQYGWGLIDIRKALNGPAQLLRDETFTVTQHDTWSNDLTGNFRFTKQGKGNLTLRGNTQLHTINNLEGRINLTGKTTASQLHNQATLSIADVTVTERYQASPNSTLILNGSAGITAKDNADIILAGKLTVAENRLSNAVSGTNNTLLTLQDKANYQGGFTQLTPSQTLKSKGLRQDIYFTDNGITLKVNKEETFRDPSASHDAQTGLTLLNKLRDTPTAWRKGFYNNWLQTAIENGNLQNLHYAVTNTLYANSLDFLRHTGSAQLINTHAILNDHQYLAPHSTKLWLNNHNAKHKSINTPSADKMSGKTHQTEFGLAHRLNDDLLFSANIHHQRSTFEKSAASADIKQMYLNGGIRYQPSKDWFIGTSAHFGNVRYHQKREFNGSTLGKADNKGWLFGAEARLGKNILFKDGWMLEPSVGLQAVRLTMKSLKETGELPISTRSFKTTDTNALAAVQVKKTFEPGSWKISPTLNISYIRRLNAGATQMSSHINGIRFNNKASLFHKHHLHTELGVMFEKNHWTLATSFGQSWFNNGISAQGNAKITYRF